MAENEPNFPGGSLPPKPSEAAKVQPKKETVRISLPPKPSATIKLPTLPGSSSAPATSRPPAPAPTAPPAPPSARPVAPPPSARPVASPAPAHGTGASAAARPSGIAPRPATGAQVPRPAPGFAKAPANTISGLDTGLAIAAVVVALAAAAYMWFGILTLQ